MEEDETKCFLVSILIGGLVLLGMVGCTSLGIDRKAAAMIECQKSGGSATDCSLGIQRIN